MSSQTQGSSSPSVTNIKILKGADPDDKFTITFQIDIENMSSAALGKNYHVKFYMTGITNEFVVNGKRIDQSGSTHGFLQYTPSKQYPIKENSYILTNVRLYHCELSKLPKSDPIETIPSLTAQVYTNLNSFQ